MRSLQLASVAILSVLIAACATTVPGRLARASIINSSATTVLPSIRARYDSESGTCSAGSVQLLSRNDFQNLTEGWKAPKTKCDGPEKLTLPTFGDYPRILQRTKVDGSAQVLVRLGADGIIESVRAVCATDFAFGDAAVETARRIRFGSMKCDTQPTRVAFLLPMDYEI